MSNHDNETTPVDTLELEGVCGGFKWQDLPPSNNVEDRRHLSPRDSMRAPSQPPQPMPPLVRTPGDLSSQAGLDHIGPQSGRR